MKRWKCTAIAFVPVVIAACSSSTNGSSTTRTRTYRMGFSNFPPRFDSTIAVNSVLMWMQRADGAIMHVDPPWGALLAGAKPESAVAVLHSPIVAVYRARGLKLFLTVDITDGLNRGAEAPELVAAGRSITEPAVQQLYRRFVVALDTLLHPDFLGLAAETNLIQAAAPAPIYAAVVTMTNAAAADVRAIDPTRKLYVSVQVETAWGRLGNGGSYLGIARDYTDFPFIDAFGLSSYPYLGGFADPADIPDDYYSRLTAGHTTPVMVVEGGWASASGGTFTSDPARQARYLARQRDLLDRVRAIGVFQLTFADLDTTGAGFPPGVGGFIALGVVDDNLTPKPALATWDSTFARTLLP